MALLPAAVRGVAFVAAYVALDWVSFLYEFSPLGFTPWNPQSGLSLAFLLLTTPLNALWLPPAALIADFVVRGWPASPALAVMSALVLSAGYAAAAHLLRRRMAFDPALETMRDVVSLFILGVFASLVGAFLYAGLYAAAGLVALSDFPVAASRHWVGDVIGITVVTPMLLRLIRQRDALAAGPGLEVIAQLAAVVLVVWIVFLPQTDEFKFFYLLFLPVVWAAVRGGLDGAATTIAATQLGLIVAAQIRHFAPDTVVEFQILMLALAFTGLLVGAVVSERRRTQAALHASEARLREHQAELAQFSRSSTMGEMASSLAHELSQPLSATATYLSACGRLLQQPNVDFAQIRNAIAKAEVQAKRAGQVLAGLRDFLYRGETHLIPTPVSELLNSVASLVRGEVERIGAALSVNDATLGAAVLVDRIQIEQALLNLLRNSAEALSERPGGRREMRIEARADDPWIDIVVTDTGPGVAPDVAETLFQPFVSTKARGMGLGLTITRSIVDAHGGELNFEAGPEGGASFRIRLPRTDET